MNKVAVFELKSHTFAKPAILSHSGETAIKTDAKVLMDDRSTPREIGKGDDVLVSIHRGNGGRWRNLWEIEQAVERDPQKTERSRGKGPSKR